MSPANLAVPDASCLPKERPALQRVPGSCARLALRVGQSVQKQLQELKGLPDSCPTDTGGGTALLLAVSGGADSTALAVLLALVARRLRLRLHVCCCDHGLRPESAAEARFVQALAAWLDLPCQVIRLELTEKNEAPGTGALLSSLPGLEEKARTARYAALERVRQEVGAQAICCAHHANDLGEDIVMRLVRGTGWPGLGGMPGVDAGRSLVRPLLFVRKTELVHFLQALAIPWCEDPSNASLEQTRSRLRHTVLPLLFQENPQLDRSFQTLATLARLDADYFAGQLAPLLAQCQVQEAQEEGEDGTGSLKLHVSKKLLASLPPSLRLRLYHALVQKLAQERAAICPEKEWHGQVQARTLLALEEAYAKPQRPKVFQLPGSISLVLTGKGVDLEAILS